jgi:D-amino-acid dehydrogenase
MTSWYVKGVGSHGLARWRDHVELPPIKPVTTRINLHAADGRLLQQYHNGRAARRPTCPPGSPSTSRRRALEPPLVPAFRHAVFWELAASISNPLAVTQAYAARFKALGGVAVKGDALRLHRTAARQSR